MALGPQGAVRLRLPSQTRLSPTNSVSVGKFVRLSQQDKVVPMDELRLVDVAEDRLDLAGGLADDLACLARGVVCQAARDFAAGRVEAGHDFAALEFPAHLAHPDGQQALAVARERFDGAG